MEMWDIYDGNRQKTNLKVERDTEFTKDMFRLTVHICIFNSKGELLIQQRSASKKNFPNVWDITLGGNVQAGETSQQAAERELNEELFIKHDFGGDRPYLTVNFDNGFDDYYILKEDIDIKTIKFFDNEVQAVRWAGLDEILQLIKKGMFINYYPSFITALFEMKKHRGVFNI